MKFRITALEVIADELLEIALIVLLGQPLPGLEIEPCLIEPSAETLAVLCDEARHETACDDGAYQQQAIEQASDKRHRRARGGDAQLACMGARQLPTGGSAPRVRK